MIAVSFTFLMKIEAQLKRVRQNKRRTDSIDHGFNRPVPTCKMWLHQI